MEELKRYIQRIVDNIDSKLIDKITIYTYVVLSIITLYLYLCTYKIFYSPTINVHTRFIYSLLFIISISFFYISMMGDKTSKPINRPRIFIIMSIIVSVNAYCLLAETINSAFTSFLNNLVGFERLPSYLLLTNIRIMSIYVPFFIVFFFLYQSFSIPFIKKTKNELLEYSIDLLTRNIHEISEKTININICEDISTGEKIILSEQASKQHTLIAGSSGSGKTALELRPILAQLFYKKAYFREQLKKLAFKAVEEGICYVRGPVTNKYINENFSMEHIGICEGKEEEFKEHFKDYIIGIRDSNRSLYNDFLSDKEVEIIMNASSEVINRTIKVEVYKYNMIYAEYDYIYQDNKLTGDNIKEEDFSVEINLLTKLIDDEDKEVLVISTNTNSNKYKFKLQVEENCSGKIIYRDLGVTVVAPDGGLPSNCFEIAKKNGVKVHRIDPKMEEIQKGVIAKFNPLMVGTPEKAADVISSILVAMEQSSGKDVNPYFTNASIRAIRNIVILLRITYPKLRGKNPTLVDVLDILNDFNSVREYVEELLKDSRLELRWRSVIDYFVTSFYPQPKDQNGNLLYTTNEGTNRKKTADAISGVINQLDNLLGREELRYILCDGEEGLNLSDVLERGECIAIATRQSELGNILGQAFALMFILSIQNAVLCRYSEDENPEIPHYLICDEFPFYLNDNLKVFFTFSRKYKCSLIVAIQNIAQLCEESEVFKQIIFSNTDTKIILPGSNVEDRKYYSEMLGNEEVFETQTGVSQNPLFSEKANYSETTRGAMVEKARVSTQELADLQFKRCYYSYTNAKGYKKIGKGFIDFLKLTDENTLKSCYYNFKKYYKVVNEDSCVLNNCNSEVESESNDINDYKNIEEVILDQLTIEDATNEISFNADKSNEAEIDENICNNDSITEKVLQTDNNTKSYNILEQQLLNEDLSNIRFTTDEIEHSIDDVGVDDTNIDDLNIDDMQVIGIAKE